MPVRCKDRHMECPLGRGICCPTCPDYPGCLFQCFIPLRYDNYKEVCRCYSEEEKDNKGALPDKDEIKTLKEVCELLKMYVDTDLNRQLKALYQHEMGLVKRALKIINIMEEENHARKL